MQSGHVKSGWLRLARAWLFHVLGHEPRSLEAAGDENGIPEGCGTLNLKVLKKRWGTLYSSEPPRSMMIFLVQVKMKWRVHLILRHGRWISQDVVLHIRRSVVPPRRTAISREDRWGNRVQRRSFHIFQPTINGYVWKWVIPAVDGHL